MDGRLSTNQRLRIELLTTVTVFVVIVSSNLIRPADQCGGVCDKYYCAVFPYCCCCESLTGQKWESIGVGNGLWLLVCSTINLNLPRQPRGQEITGSTVVMLSNEDYIKEADRQLNNQRYYLKLNVDLTPKFVTEIKSFINSMFTRGQINKKIKSTWLLTIRGQQDSTLYL